MRTKTIVKGYVAYKLARPILALFFGLVMLALCLLPALVDLYQRYVVNGVPLWK
jgi:hypothetical protein